jgi:hypothetical protein
MGRTSIPGPWRLWSPLGLLLECGDQILQAWRAAYPTLYLLASVIVEDKGGRGLKADKLPKISHCRLHEIEAEHPSLLPVAFQPIHDGLHAEASQSILRIDLDQYWLA